MSIPTIRTDGVEINFGNIKFGKGHTKMYKVTNISDNPVKITGLGKSCTCTEVSCLSPQLPPGGYSFIDVKITPGSTGKFLRNFWFSIDNVGNYNVTLKASVE
jgi:hypothetical protein